MKFKLCAVLSDVPFYPCLPYKMTERSKILIERYLNSKAYDKNDPKKLIRNYIEDSRDESDKFDKMFVKE